MVIMINFRRLLTTKNKLQSHKNVCENKDFGNAVIPSQAYCKSDKPPFIIYTDLESLIVKIDGCIICITEKLSTTKVSEHIPSGFPMSSKSSFKDIEDKHNVYRGKYSLKKFCESLREQAIKIINFKMKKMSLLTNKHAKKMQKECTIFIKKRLKINILIKVRLLVKTLLMEIILRLKVTMNQVKTKKLCFGYFCRFVTSALTLRPRNTYIRALFGFCNFLATSCGFWKLGVSSFSSTLNFE